MGTDIRSAFGDDSTVHRHGQGWYYQRGWSTSSDLKGVDWQWQADDTAMGKVPWQQLSGPQSHRPQRRGVKRSLVVEAASGPLGATLAGANVHDTKWLVATRAAMVVERPQPTEERPQHLYRDKGNAHPTGHETVATHQDIPHIPRIGEDKLDPQGRSPILRASGWWNGRWHGSPSAEACLAGMRKRPSIS